MAKTAFVYYREIFCQTTKIEKYFGMSVLLGTHHIHRDEDVNILEEKSWSQYNWSIVAGIEEKSAPTKTTQ